MVRGVVLLLDDDDTRFASRLPSFPCLPPLIFLYFIISVYSYRVCLRVYPSLFRCLVCFFLSIFEFFFFSLFFWGEFFFHACCVNSRARVFPTRGADFFFFFYGKVVWGWFYD